MNRTDRNRLDAAPWIGLALAVACALGFAVAWVQARREATALRDWQATMLQHIQTARGGDTPLDSGQAFDALDRIVAKPTAPVPPSTTEKPADPKPPAPDADSRTEIGRLRRTQSTGTAVGDAQIIERDSRAAWTGWK